MHKQLVCIVSGLKRRGAYGGVGVVCERIVWGQVEKKTFLPEAAMQVKYVVNTPETIAIAIVIGTILHSPRPACEMMAGLASYSRGVARCRW